MRRPNPTHRFANIAVLALIGILSLAVATGCGKPEYCSNLNSLQAAVKDLPSSATSGGVQGLENQLQTIENETKSLVSSAKSDFPNQSSALESAVNQLKTSVKALPEKPSATQLAAIGINASAVVSSASAFQSATADKCK
jgi:hypothetical protein